MRSSKLYACVLKWPSRWTKMNKKIVAVHIWVDKGILFVRSLNIAENTTQDNSQNINNNQ